MLGSVLISGLLLSSPDTTTGFTLVPEHSVFLGQSYASFEEVCAAREGIYDLGVGSIHIPQEDGSFQLAIIVYGSQKAQILQFERARAYLKSELTLVDLPSPYFGTPFGSKPTRLAKSREPNETTSSFEPGQIDSERPADFSEEIDSLNPLILNLTAGSDLPEVMTLELKESNLSSTLANGVQIDTILKSKAEVVTYFPHSVESLLMATRNEPNLPTATEFSAPNVIKINGTSKDKGSIDTAVVATLKPNSLAIEEPAKTQTSRAADLDESKPNPAIIKIIPPKELLKSDASMQRSSQGGGNNSNKPVPIEPANQKSKINVIDQALSKNVLNPKSQVPDLAKSQRDQYSTNNYRKPFREISIKKQEPENYYIVFGHFDNKTNAQYFARSIRKKFDETHLAPSQQGFRVLMLADQNRPQDQLKEIRQVFPKAWLSKPKKPKVTIVDKL